jgi:hypothetical protein
VCVCVGGGQNLKSQNGKVEIGKRELRK